MAGGQLRLWAEAFGKQRAEQAPILEAVLRCQGAKEPIWQRLEQRRISLLGSSQAQLVCDGIRAAHGA